MKLLPEQEEDAQKMASANDLPNFSKAGTGKTHTALRAIQLVGAQRGLVLAPKIALTMWGEEIKSFLGADVQVIRSGQSPFKGTDFIITTYDLAKTLKGKLVEEFHRQHAVEINDESHAVNNPGAKRTQAVFGEKLDLVGSIAEQFDQVWNLTGTPMTGYADDMFTQAAVLHPEIFSTVDAETYPKFEKRFTFKRQKQYNPRMQPTWKIAGNLAEGLLNKLVYHDLKAIRRLEAPGLPAVRHRDLVVDITLNSATRKALAGMTMQQITAAINDPNSIAAKVWHMVGLLKVAEALPYVGECAKIGPILLGIWHRDVGDAYHTALEDMGFTVAHVNGSTSDKQKDYIQTEFNNGLIDVLVGQMSAMGVSWNLQKTSAHVIIGEEYPSHSVIEQFFKRVYRYGQRNSVQVDYITSDTGIDTALRGVRERKTVSDEKING